MDRVLVFGTFDHLHPGHLFLLQNAERCGQLYVVIARDATVQTIKGHTPDHNEQERAQAVQEAMPNAVVTLGHETEFTEPIIRVRPDRIVLGYDQQLPPGVTEEDFPCPVERLEAHEPEKYKSSLYREG